MSNIMLLIICVSIVLWITWGISIMRRKIMISVANNLSITTNNLALLANELVKAKTQSDVTKE